MASPHRPQQHHAPASGRSPEPDDVHDHTLWALAAAVTAAHRAGADGLCTNLQCHGQRAPCGPARTAHAAARLARRPPTAPRSSPSADRHPARGRAVSYRPSGLAGLIDAPEPTTAVDATNEPTVFTPFRRPLAAATPRQQEESP